MADQKIQIIISALTKGVNTTFSKAGNAVKAFRAEVGGGNRVMDSFNGAIIRTVGALGGLFALRDITGLMINAEKATFGLESSLMAANRQFDVGSMQDWEATLARLSGKLRIYSNTELKNAATRTIDMTKRLGLSRAQMEQLIETTADLSAGKTDLNGGIERVTAALRGEAESAEYLGLTLNENYIKAWYEASDAHEKAWKDLNELEKAQIRYQVLLEQALPFQGKSADSITTLSGAYKLMTKEISDSLEKNKDIAGAMKEVAKVFRENGDEIGALISQLAGLIAKTIEFVAQNKNVVLTVGLITVGLLALAKTITTFTAIWRGANAAMLVMTQMQIIPWLAGVNAALTGVIGTTLTLSGVLATAAAAAAAFFAAYKITEWLVMRGAMKDIADETARLNRYTAATSAKFLEISRATGVTITSMEELDKAVDEGRIHFDELTSTWKKGAGEQAAAVQASTDTQKQVTAEALEEMKRKYKEYGDQIKRIQDDIAGREQSLQEKLRSMGRTGMSDLGAWRDRKREADQYYAAAQRAAAAGNHEEAVKLADKAQAAYEDLNKEVKDGEKVQISAASALKTSMKGVESAGRLAVDILNKQKKAAENAQAALDDKSGGELSGKLQAATKATEDLNKVIQDSGGDWSKVWDQMQRDGKQAIDATEKEIVRLTRDREVNVYINEIVKKATGGIIQKFATGGKLAGYGGGDRIPALLEAGEYIIRKEAVSKFGANIFNALNSLRLPKFATGGAVGSAVSAGSGDTVTVNFSFPSGRTVGPFRGTRAAIRELDRERRHMQLGGSGA